MLRRFGKGAVVALLAGALLPAAARADYSFVTVDVPGGNTNQVLGISNNGVAVGDGVVGTTVVNFTYNIATNTYTPITSGLVDGDQLNGLNTTNTYVGQTSGAVGISGALSGGAATSRTPFSQPTTTAVSYLGNGINDGGTIVGHYTDAATGITHGTVLNSALAYTNTAADAGGTSLTLDSELRGINNHGLAVGFYFEAANTSVAHGYLYDTTTKTPTLLADPTGSTFTQFNAINDSGTTAGYFIDSSGNAHGFLRDSGGKFTVIDVVINGVTQAQTAIFGLDNQGDISGFYIDASGAQHGFVASLKTVPEPASLALFALGGTLAATCRRRRRA
jgi:hypothetical protein